MNLAISNKVSLPRRLSAPAPVSLPRRLSSPATEEISFGYAVLYYITTYKLQKFNC